VARKINLPFFPWQICQSPGVTEKMIYSEISGKKEITLVNFNLMYARLQGMIDWQAYLPLGLLYLTSTLEREGFRVDIRDYQLQVCKTPFDINHAVSFLDSSADIVGFSCMANLLPFTILVAKELKQRYPEKFIILGGVGPSGVAHHIIEHFPFIDVVVRGEGEKTIVELIKSISNASQLKNIKGITFRIHNEIFNNPPQERIMNLDSIPPPAYERINFKDYDAAPSIITSRGCPYKCAFCTENTVWGHKVVFREIRGVVEEIKILHDKYQKNTFLIQDDNFVLHQERIFEFCDELKKSNLNIQWKCFGRIDLMNGELMKTMSKAGCVQIRYGIESGSNRTLEKIDKQFTIEEAEKVVRQSLNYFPSVHTSFIYGYPLEVESMEDFQQTVNKVECFDKMGATTYLFLLSPLPENRIYNEHKGKLDLSRELWSDFISTGQEDRWNDINLLDKKHKPIYDLIVQYPYIFPGFYHYDWEHNVLPKLRVVKKRNLFDRKIRKIGKDYKIDL